MDKYKVYHIIFDLAPLRSANKIRRNGKIRPISNFQNQFYVNNQGTISVSEQNSNRLPTQHIITLTQFWMGRDSREGTLIRKNTVIHLTKILQLDYFFTNDDLRHDPLTMTSRLDTVDDAIVHTVCLPRR